MKQLGDETYDYRDQDKRRTIWYQLDEEDFAVDAIFGPADPYGGRMVQIDADFSSLTDLIQERTQSDLERESDATETQWVFYTPIITGDALGDQVRFTVLVRKRSGKWAATVNVSDYIFASSFDQVQDLTEEILKVLT